MPKKANDPLEGGSCNSVPVGVPPGIRTPVTAVKGRCPRPLDDGDTGGASRDRTGDLYNAIVALSQLSYSPELRRGRILARRKIVKNFLSA